MATLNSTTVRKAIDKATDHSLLTRIARTQEEIYDREFTKSDVATVDLAAAILNNPEMTRIVDWFAGPVQADEIACMVGELIAASVVAARA